jgi:hypothetical protein
MNDDLLLRRLDELEHLERSLLDLAMKCMQAYEGAIYPMDLLANGASNRTLALGAGFRRMIAERNMICAGSLLRLQIDTALRFYASFLVEDAHNFATKVLNGTRIDQLKDRNGKRLQDYYLIKRLSETENLEWLDRVYKETSGYIHLSGKHLYSTFNGLDDEKRTIEIKIGATDIDLPKEIYVEAVDAFLAATNLFMKYLQGWGITKQNPEEVARLREERNDPAH